MQTKRKPPEVPLISTFDLLWNYRRREPTALNIFRAARAAHIWKHATGILRARIALRYLQWFWRLPKTIIASQVQYGKITAQTFDRSQARQTWDLVRLAVRNNLPPVDYYKGGLARYQGNPSLFKYIPEQLYETMLAFLRGSDSGRRQGDSRKKLHFEQQCNAHDIPCVRTIAVAEPDGSFSGLSGSLPPQSLFLKPARGTQGKGAERWHYRDAGYLRMGRDERVSAQGLLQRASESARRENIPTLIQEALMNHSDIQKLAGETIATSRVITLINEAGTPEVVYAAMRLASRRDSPADNFHSGGISFPVSTKDGRMGVGVRLDFCENPRFWTVNPLTGARIEGIVQPCYRDVWALALKCHTAMSDRLLMGWDIATTPNGPVVVEGGGRPGMPMVCQLGLHGFLGTRLSTLLAWHVSNRLAQTEPPHSRWRFAGMKNRKLSRRRLKTPVTNGSERH